MMIVHSETPPAPYLPTYLFSLEPGKGPKKGVVEFWCAFSCRLDGFKFFSFLFFLFLDGKGFFSSLEGGMLSVRGTK